MFSIQQKRTIADHIQKILRRTHHPELPEEEIHFDLLVYGATRLSWAKIQNNSAVPKPTMNPGNERQANPERHGDPV